MLQLTEAKRTHAVTGIWEDVSQRMQKAQKCQKNQFYKSNAQCGRDRRQSAFLAFDQYADLRALITKKKELWEVLDMLMTLIMVIIQVMCITNYQVVNLLQVQLKTKPEMVTHTCNLSTQEIEAGTQ